MDTTPTDRVRLIGEARDRLAAWSEGAQALSLLSSVHRLGWTHLLREPRSFGELVRHSSIPRQRLRDGLDALVSLKIVEQSGDEFRLTAPFAEMLTPDGLFHLGDKLDEARLMARLVGEAVKVNGLPMLSSDDAVAVARGATFQATEVGRAVFRETLNDVPEYAAALGQGRVLDVGCGVASGLLTTAALFPTIYGLGLELVPAVAAEAARRAVAQGVADRIEIRATDARHFDEPGAYNACFWAQPFFSADARLPTLRAIHRALAPGGILLEQELDSKPTDTAHAPAFALRRMVFHSWGTSFATTAEHLAVEAQAAGFTLIRIATTNLGRMVVLRR
ncbi:class I SAM-dependent methyltransferase [Micromonospora sp. WMMD961]|uniref:SAM-dependent methyltransferase n=1 Tax=Micromonospora sp. WMMD961 TaxID=3016100 RepID=UPI002415C735|nr:class I SAM-dependent methyltransferase [Micromonospora sp. WMMD961]MDG4782423.1 class I SAM-dependent methyltransferase [Micromonospora sp. WMMD961]